MHWQNWAGLESADPCTVATPTSVDEVVEAVTTARGEGSTVKMIGSGPRIAEFIDEIPDAYKSIDVVMEDARDLVTVLHELRQIMNVKGT